MQPLKSDGPPHFIHGQWCDGTGEELAWANPATAETTWRGRAASEDEVNRAVKAAQAGFERWCAMSFDQRVEYAEAFRNVLQAQSEPLARTISEDTGKPLWESRLELQAMQAKVRLSIEAYQERRAPVRRESGTHAEATRFKPHGVTAVLGPFNLPGHLPHAHILPALLAGNSIVFKPSEQAPAVAHRFAQLWESVGLPDGVFNMIQGARETGRTLVEHPDLNGLFFTGGYHTGKAICRTLAEHPEKIVALEMGGNNPLGVWEAADAQIAAYYIVQSAFITSGQRCTCARRLILPDGPDGARYLESLIDLTRRLRIGPFTDQPEPFMGPVISSHSAEKLLSVQDGLRSQGGEPLLELKRCRDHPAFLSPGIIDVTRVRDRPDEKIFGPLLQVIRVPDFNALIDEANRTAFGLAAGLLSDRRERFDEFHRKVKAGIINWNGPTTGAKGTLPFGGVGRSGNHRPSGYYAADYCSYPIASIEHTSLKLPQQPVPGVFS